MIKGVFYMNFEGLKKIIDLLPDGNKKRQLINKLHALKKQKSTGKEGLMDEFTFKPVGHIRIEEIDEHGNPVGVLADQANLVVQGAEEILLRAFSGDPERMIFKNRIPKNGTTKIYHIDANVLISEENDQKVVVHHPNELWKVVDDEDFNIEYSYYPVTVYVKEEAPKEPGKKAFRITTTSDEDSAPLTSEVYSTYTNLFIGIGDGKNYEVQLDDPRLTFTSGFTGDASRKETSTLNSEVSFSQKISHFVVEFMKHNKGGQLEVYVDGVLKQTIETFDSSLADGEEVPGFVEIAVDSSKETEIRIKCSGADPSVTDPKWVLTGFRWDAFSKEMNGLIRELPTFVTKFDTPEVYNTTTTAPYVIQLKHYPVIPESVSVQYNGVAFERVESINDVTEGTFFVDERSGKVYFNRALTGLYATYEITGEIHEDEIAASLPTVSINVPKTDIFNGDGTQTTFKLTQTGIIVNSVTVNVNGTTLVAPDDYTVNYAENEIVLAAAPDNGTTITVQYEYKTNALKYVLSYAIQDELIRMFDQNQAPLALVQKEEFAPGSFMIDENDTERKTILVHPKLTDGSNVATLDVYYKTLEMPGVPTNYRRQIILKPKTAPEYPWFELDKGSVQFVAEFHENVPNYNVTIREMGLFDGPRADDHVKGYDGYPVKAFSLVRVGETRKDVSTGIRITWTITLLNENGEPFKGGY
jgi:hypothetical protein